MTLLTDEQRQIRDLAREFAEGGVRPHAEGWDAAGAIPSGVTAELAEVGFWGMLAAEEHGGLGLDATTWLLVLEELARGDASLALLVGLHSGPVTKALAGHASDALRTAWLPRLASGEVLGTLGLADAGRGGTDAATVRMAAAGSDWQLTGTEPAVAGGAGAGLVLVFAATDDSGSGAACLAVERPAAGWPQVAPVSTMGLRASAPVALGLDGLVVPGAARLGDGAPASDGMAPHGVAHDVTLWGRLALAAIAVGIGRAALEHATRYADERSQFGRALSSFDATRAKLGEMAARVSAARAAVHDVGMRLSAATNGDPSPGRGIEALAARAAGAKLVAVSAARHAADEAVQIFGGYGYMRDYPVERLMRDIEGIGIHEGTCERLRSEIALALLESPETTTV